MVHGTYLLPQRKTVAPTREILAKPMSHHKSAFRTTEDSWFPRLTLAAADEAGGAAEVNCLVSVFSRSYAWGSLAAKVTDITGTVRVTPGRTG